MSTPRRPSMQTQVTERLGIAMPLLAFSHSADVVVAVSRAGGMGVLGAAQLSVDELEEKLAWLDEVLGDVPYGVDLLLPGRYEKADEGGLPRAELIAQVPDAHRAFVAGLMEEYGVPELEEGYEFVGAVAADTVRSRACTGRPARQLRSGWSEAWEDAEVEPLGMPHQGILYAEPQVRIARGAEQDAGRSRELATYFVGQVVGRLDSIRPAAVVFDEIVTDCAALIER